jgi:hypothetical protein
MASTNVSSASADDRKAATVSPPFLTKGVGFSLRGSILEQKAVWNVLAPSGGKVLLRQKGGPAKPGENRPNQVVFGLGLVWIFRCRELAENSAKISGQGVDFGVGQKLPVGNAPVWRDGSRFWLLGSPVFASVPSTIACRPVVCARMFTNSRSGFCRAACWQRRP